MIIYSILILVVFSADYGGTMPFYEQNSESKFLPPEDLHTNHEKIGLESQPTPSTQPEPEEKTEIETNSIKTETKITEDGNAQLAKKWIDVSEVREKIDEGDHSDETEIRNIDLETLNSASKDTDSEIPSPTNESSTVETAIPPPPLENKDISQVQRSPQKLDVTTTDLPPPTPSSVNPSSMSLPETKDHDFDQISHDIAAMKEVISPETTVIPTLPNVTPSTQGIEGTINTHDTTAPSTTMSVLPSLESSVTEAIPTFPNLKKTVFSFGSSEELESGEEEFPAASTTMSSEIVQQPTQRVDILTTKLSEIVLPTEHSTTSPALPSTPKEPEPSVSQETKSEASSLSTTLTSPTLPAILVPTVQPTLFPKMTESQERSFWLKILDGVRCSMKDCAGVLNSNYYKDGEIREFTITRFVRDHESAQIAPSPCPCGTKRPKKVKRTKTTSASTNINDMTDMYF